MDNSFLFLSLSATSLDMYDICRGDITRFRLLETGTTKAKAGIKNKFINSYVIIVIPMHTGKQMSTQTVLIFKGNMGYLYREQTMFSLLQYKTYVKANQSGL